MKDIAQKTKIELEKDLRDKRESLRKFRFDTTGSKVKNVREGRALKKEIARIFTVLNNPNK